MTMAQASADLLHARANRHEWQTWLRDAGLPDLQGTRAGMDVESADADLFANLIASGKVVTPFDIEVDSGHAYLSA